MKRLKVLVFAIMVLMVFSSGAYADIVYSATENYNSASIGTIAGRGYQVSKDQVTALGGDTQIFSFKDYKGDEKVLIRETNGPADDAVSIYTPGQWREPDNKGVTGLGANIYGVAVVEQYLYFVTFLRYEGGVEDSGQVIRIDMANGYRRDDDKTFDLPSSVESDRHTMGVSIKAWNNKIYVVTAVRDGSYNWYPGEVIEFDKDLQPTQQTVPIGSNAGAMTDSAFLYEGKLYIGCAGSTLGTEPEAAGYWEVDLATMKSKRIIDLNDDSHLLDKPYSGSGVAITPEGTAFLMLTNFDAGYSAKLYVTSVSEMIGGSIGEEVSQFPDRKGYSASVFYDNNTETLWCAVGTDLEARAKDGSPLRTFKPIDLGNDIYSVAVVKSAGSGGGGGESGGGGCDSGFLGGFGLLALLAFCASRVLRVSSKCRGNLN
ncbi:MAG: hypothetical protein LBS45_08250 [Synergistaceae bacterium]|jgi:hypothetical protein|nr:hypothetical protein [Synergistaceae bacterium]